MVARIFSSLPARLAITLLLACIAMPGTGRADTIVYNNLTSIVGSQANGGATSPTGNTALLADDIIFQAGYVGFRVTSFTLAVANGGAASEPATLTALFYAADGTNGGPGTLLNSATMTTTFANGQTFQTFTGANLFTIPASGKIWAGFYFTGGAAGSLTALNSLGSYYEQSPTVGSSTTSVFVGSGTATTGSNPAGSLATNPSGQGGNFGISFAVPEPSSVWFTVLGVVGLGGMIARRRRSLNPA